MNSIGNCWPNVNRFPFLLMRSICGKDSASDGNRSHNTEDHKQTALDNNMSAEDQDVVHHHFLSSDRS